MSDTIRRATREDAPGIADVLRSGEQLARLAAEPLETTVARVAAMLELCIEGSSHSVLVASSDGVVDGYLSAHWLPYLFLNGPEGFISELFVHAERRGRGAGSALLDAIILEARERGCARLQLINMRDRESYLRGFYAGRGWEERPDGASFVLRL